jgi:hypothetical protein
VSIRVRIHRALFDACVSQERVQIQLCSVSVGGPLRRLPEVILYVVRNIRGYSCRAPKAAYRALRDKGERIAQSEIQRRGISPPLSRISRHARQLQLEMWHKRLYAGHSHTGTLLFGGFFESASKTHLYLNRLRDARAGAESPMHCNQATKGFPRRVPPPAQPDA